MKHKYYAVKIGRVPGIYTTWSECEKQVKYYKNAQFKSFKFKSDALKFISNKPMPKERTLAEFW